VRLEWKLNGDEAKKMEHNKLIIICLCASLGDKFSSFNLGLFLSVHLIYFAIHTNFLSFFHLPYLLLTFYLFSSSRIILIKATIPRYVTSFPSLLSEPYSLFSVLNIAQSQSFFIHQLMHKWIVLKTILKFTLKLTLKQFLHVSVQTPSSGSALFELAKVTVLK
jgi:hypothetical protein